MRSINVVSICAITLLLLTSTIGQAQSAEALKAEVKQSIQEDAKLAQVMVDKVFSFAELGFQEYETSKYLTDILEEHGFTICLLYTSPSPRDRQKSRMPSSA